MPILNKRQTELLKVIREKSFINVRDLFPLFDVSEVTLRKDLSFLQELNYITRTRGEVQIVNDSDIIPLYLRATQNISGKTAIAKVAVTMIHDGDTIILDSGSTNVEIAKLLIDRENLYVITNSISIATILADSKVRLTMPGGDLLGKNMGLQGPVCNQFFENIEVDTAILGCGGIRENVGPTVQDTLERSLKQAMMKAARHKCAVFDSSKFDKRGMYPFSKFNDFDTVINDTRVPNAELERLSKRGEVNWIIADELSWE